MLHLLLLGRMTLPRLFLGPRPHPVSDEGNLLPRDDLGLLVPPLERGGLLGNI